MLFWGFIFCKYNFCPTTIENSRKEIFSFQYKLCGKVYRETFIFFRKFSKLGKIDPLLAFPAWVLWQWWYIMQNYYFIIYSVDLLSLNGKSILSVIASGEKYMLCMSIESYFADFEPK